MVSLSSSIDIKRWLQDGIQGLQSFFDAFRGHKATKGPFFPLKPGNDFSKRLKTLPISSPQGIKSPHWMWLILCVCARACLYVCVEEPEERVQHFTSIFSGQVKFLPLILQMFADPARLHYITAQAGYKGEDIVHTQMCIFLHGFLCVR